MATARSLIGEMRKFTGFRCPPGQRTLVRMGKTIGRAATVAFLLASIIGPQFARAEEPHEVVRTEFGSEYSDGSSTIVGHSATFSSQNGFVLLRVDSARPVYRAVLTLQTRYGHVITYEDPRYTNEDDLEDVSAEVVRNDLRRRMVLLPFAKHTTPGIPAVVFTCVPAPELQNVPPKPGTGTAGTVVPQQ